MNLGGTIKRLRKEKGIKQNLFAETCGISQTYLSQVESNAKEPNLSTLKTISEHLSMPLPVLFFLCIDEEDIDIGKREAYKIIGPSIQSFITEFFIHPSTKND